MLLNTAGTEDRQQMHSAVRPSVVMQQQRQQLASTTVATADRNALLQSIRAGKELHHVARPSIVSRQQQQQQQQGLPAHVSAYSDVDDGSHAAEEAAGGSSLMQAIRSGKQLNHVTQAPAVQHVQWQQQQQQQQALQQVEQHELQGMQGYDCSSDAAAAVGGRGALLQAIRTGTELQHVHRPSMMTTQGRV